MENGKQIYTNYRNKLDSELQINTVVRLQDPDTNSGKLKNIPDLPSFFEISLTFSKKFERNFTILEGNLVQIQY